MLKILQINLNRCRLAQEIMIHNACELKADVVIISESYRCLPEWSGDTNGDAAVWVTGFRGKFATLTPITAAKGIVAVEVDDIIIISCYCLPPRPNRKMDFGSYMDELEAIIFKLRAPGKEIVLAGDLNAKSPSWGGGGRKTDTGGRLCMGLLDRHGLTPIRLKANYTFHRNGGTSVIDVMSADRATARFVYVLHTLGGRGGPRPPPLGHRMT